MMTDRIRTFLDEVRPDSPCLVVDLETVQERYLAFRRALPDTAVHYAVKANPAPDVLRLLVQLGSAFDAASLPEIRAVLAAGASAERISYGNTIKKERDIAAAHALGVRMFAVDSFAELDKVARAAPGAGVVCRILTDGAGADWPLSCKFGCDPDMAAEILVRAKALGLVAHGIAFHVGSQQQEPDAWDRALSMAASVFRSVAERGIQLNLVNLGGGFPAHYHGNIPNLTEYARTIKEALHRHFGNRIPETVIEPGRAIVGDAGVIRSEVVLISRKSAGDSVRWVFLDIGRFNGLAETENEAIRYPIRTASDHARREPCVIAGPTCDSADVLYQHQPYPLPVCLDIGDEVLIECAGAYTAPYSSVGFNGIRPLQTYVI